MFQRRRLGVKASLGSTLRGTLKSKIRRVAISPFSSLKRKSSCRVPQMTISCSFQEESVAVREIPWSKANDSAAKGLRVQRVIFEKPFFRKYEIIFRLISELPTKKREEGKIFNWRKRRKMVPSIVAMELYRGNVDLAHF